MFPLRVYLQSVYVKPKPSLIHEGNLAESSSARAALTEEPCVVDPPPGPIEVPQEADLSVQSGEDKTK
jgi:hypothetical protein